MADLHALTPLNESEAIEPFDAGRRRCKATVRRTGVRCLKRPIRGGTVCGSHGGSAPQVRNAARRRDVTANAAALVAKQGYAPLDDPVEALLSVAGEMVALKDALANQVAALTEVTVTDRTGAENVAAVLVAYERGLERVAKVLVSMNRLDIQSRRVDIERARLELFADAVKRAVWSDVAGLEYDQGLRVIDAVVIELGTLPVSA
jgi:hypothetical protein